MDVMHPYRNPKSSRRSKECKPSLRLSNFYNGKGELMNTMKTGFAMMQTPEVTNPTTAPLIGGFVTGCAITMALIGLFAKFKE